MKKQLSEIKRMQRIAGIINENYHPLRQANEQGYWDTEDTVEYLKKELERYNIEFDSKPYKDFTALYLNFGEYGHRLITIYIKNGKVTVEGKAFDLNESDTLGDIMDYVLELMKK